MKALCCRGKQYLFEISCSFIGRIKRIDLLFAPFVFRIRYNGFIKNLNKNYIQKFVR